MEAQFGPAGVNAYFASNKKNKLTMFPAYLSSLKLSAFEYQCGHGVRVSENSAIEFGKICNQYAISLSIHAPYYISLSSIDPQKRDNSVKYILQTATIAKAMNAKKIVVHSGSCAKMSRSNALTLACQTLKHSLTALKNNSLGNIIICPEVMGKTNQLGSLEEVIELCKIDEQLFPCIDFGHLNSRLFGKLKLKKDYEQVFSAIENNLGIYKLQNMHIHFSKIEYTNPGGEKKHLTFKDETYGPDFEPLAELLVKKSIFPTIICESAGNQVEDALAMKKIYNNFLIKN